ncbi:MFS general substrate transporter [Hesseltinella vesiculosa]|uniref:MFS general substrate transporter n=1 Tax=Hesseltinella vesiculosa TaxID=101127 RepID=A0A1X2GG33_9FUNG|nr:MFS general substrate transporter [Hesseltinella vesiculosa]
MAGLWCWAPAFVKSLPWALGLHGVMQAYFLQHGFGNASNAAIQLPFVGTVGMVFLNLMGAPAQILQSMVGVKWTLLIGTILKALGLIIAGFAKETWQLIICQGIIFGSGASITYCIAMAVAPAWFRKRRALAIGIIGKDPKKKIGHAFSCFLFKASGSGIGGVAMPLMMQAINSTLGPSWSYRILGFMVLVLDLMATMLIREKNPSKERKRKRLSDIFHFDVLKDANYVIYSVASVIGLLGYFVPYFYLPSYAGHIGLTSQQGSVLVAVASACNFFGRCLMGYVADYIGKLNTNLIVTIIGGLSSLLIWTFAYDYGTLMAYAVVFGLTCASYFCLLSPIVVQLVGLDRYPSALSFLLLTNVISVFGPNIASAVEQSVGASNPYFSYKMFAGVTYLVNAVLLVILKFRLDRRPWAIL